MLPNTSVCNYPGNQVVPLSLKMGKRQILNNENAEEFKARKTSDNKKNMPFDEEFDEEIVSMEWRLSLLAQNINDLQNKCATNRWVKERLNRLHGDSNSKEETIKSVETGQFVDEHDYFPELPPIPRHALFQRELNSNCHTNEDTNEDIQWKALEARFAALKSSKK